MVTTAQTAPSLPSDLLPRPSLLLVDDNSLVLTTLSAVLDDHGFRVVAAGTVKEALALISQQTFDVLLSDLHMPGAGDGLTVVSAMRHANPAAVTFIFSGYPEMREAAEAIRQQPDEVLAKPLHPAALIHAIKSRLAKAKPVECIVETIANVLEAEMQTAIDGWLRLVREAPSICSLRMMDADRCAHLPALFQELVYRLRHPQPLGSKPLVSESAENHGRLRREQGYSAAMMVEESRMLQASIFQTLQNNLHKLDFSLLLLGVMAIADEVNAQLMQNMAGHTQEWEPAGMSAS